MLRFLNRFLATGFFSGKLPVAPGTFGSLVGLFLFICFPSLIRPLPLFLLTVLGTCVTSYEGKLTGIKDEQQLVIDEIAGMGIALMAVPEVWYWRVTAFVLFRIFDIIKPYPIKQLQKLPSGIGVMIDDVAAGIYVQIIIRMILSQI